MSKRQPRALMVQGTGSNVGKSILTTALCRIFLEDGFRVAPFKAQNMALNAYATRDGLEMSRAQALQAAACRLDPDVRMNPILIKPTTERQSQLVVMGKAMPLMTWSEYNELKPTLRPVVQEAYRSLAEGVDLIVLEGAGSPAEINLMAHDIVNMAAAEMADASVLLVGDIDAGGVFASLVGTVALLPPHQAARIKGFVLNKFRGDRAILAPGLDQIRAITGRPVVGVVPYLERLLLPEEDSVDFKSGRMPRFKKKGAAEVLCRIAVIDLPKVSNFTDLDPFCVEPDVEMMILRPGEALEKEGRPPDVVILPGSKNVAEDLHLLRQHHFDRALREFVSGGGEVVGLCGGLQMLGERIEDPHQIEGNRTPVLGLGLLPIRTVLEREKVLRLVAARHLISGLELRGYEIHHGRTEAAACHPSFVQISGGIGRSTPRGPMQLGWMNETGHVWGTYLHGLFDDDPFRRWFIDRVRERKGLPPLKEIQATYDIEAMIQRLAEVVRKELDMPAVYDLLGMVGGGNGNHRMAGL
ncbi:cobyric acid synthase [Candidatus Manganitrophus noduliformans]|uniref:Cobyric acid synthase n=1 Tax=Candidatus Manganitrophus noduliformans TaxID=2606439 RepID=A0A7X6IDL0_9BACT|nr:cobyric acid synthase [Candidatus Manganitrophus noduliformans]NKE73570.1 cobyric acid synthase [Candidatus Manganitrophus noduliformans]